MRVLIAVIALILLAGCASQQNQQYENYERAEQARLARLDTLATACETDLCRVMIAQEGTRGATPLPRQQVHPAWSIVDRAIGGDQIGGDRTVDNSTTAGRDYAGRDIYRDSCIGTDCRYSSPGPIDQSDSSNNSDNRQTDNSTQPPATD